MMERLKAFFRVSPPPLPSSERVRLDYPLRVGVAMMLAWEMTWAMITPDPLLRRHAWLWMGIGLLYGLVGYRLIHPYWNRSPWLDVAFGAFNGFWIAVILGHFPFGGSAFAVLFGIGALIYHAGVGGRWSAYVFLVVWCVVLAFQPETHNLVQIVADYLESRYAGSGIVWAYVWFFAFTAFSGWLVSEMVLHWRGVVTRHAQRLEAINRVTQALVRSINTEELISLLSDTLRESVPAETYFVALLEGDRLALKVLYDRNTFYTPMALDKERGLAGWVLRHRRALLLNDVPREIERLGLKRRLVGANEPNYSWLGVPMVFREQLVGILAVASYRRNVFTESDREMLESIAQSAAAALINAQRHAAMEEQARRDSLTGALNHAVFLESLEAWRQDASTQPFALIMLDIDNFKHYNDTYGHQMGDRVLRALVDVIRQHIKRTDLVGRWGGEEFGVALRSLSRQQAIQVASRVREAMELLQLETRQGERVPAPTVSQGIAMFPDEATTVYDLVARADKRLYCAKSSGRNLVCVDDNNTTI